ncbi:MAG TPA: M23 family metallopeptidase [Roseiarcus sp.]|nr:M23 family metallopeptidase [Roseiarcus sp.]
MNRRLAVAAGALALALAFGWLAWRLWRPSPHTSLPPIPVSPAPQPATPAHISTIIDLPGDPALVRRAVLKAPQPLSLAVPARLTVDAPKSASDAFYISEPLTPAGGGYLGKFTGNGLEAGALSAELATNTGEGDDDDGGDLTPQVSVAAPLTGANSQQLEAVAGGDNGRPQLKEAILRPLAPQKISQLLIESGYEETSAAEAEAASKRLYNVQSLPAGAVALAVGALDASGVYRVMQLAIFEDREYVGTVAVAENGLYGEGAQPTIPQGLLDEADHPPAGAHFTLADGVYSAGLRSAVPEPVIREAVHLLGGLVDLNAGLSGGETLRLLYTASPRVKGEAASRIVYAGLSGPATADCYAFELSDDGFGCFLKEEAAPAESGAPLPPERQRPGDAKPPLDTGATAIGGLLPPIRGARITSLFGMRFHPILHITRLHAGIDFGAAVGSLVRAAADGVVESAGPARGYGERVVLKHAGFETTYNHLSKILVEVGQKERQGDVVALSGNSGLSTGPHLHFEYRVNGVPNDPLPHLGKEVQGRILASASRPAFPGASIPVPPTAPRPPPDPARLAAFAAAKAEIDAALAAAQR